MMYNSMVRKQGALKFGKLSLGRGLAALIERVSSSESWVINNLKICVFGHPLSHKLGPSGESCLSHEIRTPLNVFSSSSLNLPSMC